MSNMEAARKTFRIFRYDSDNVRTSGATYGQFGKQVHHRHHTHQKANNICTSVIENMATMRNYEVMSDKIKLYKTYTETMLFTNNNNNNNNNKNSNNNNNKYCKRMCNTRCLCSRLDIFLL